VDLSIVIPVFNEEQSIPLLVDEVCHRLEGKLDYEIIVVDDGSHDATAGVLRACRQQYGRLRVLQHRVRCGQSAAISSGVRAARASLVATLDGDGQNDPADILRLYKVMQEAPGNILLVIGNRVWRKDSWLKRISSRLANAVRARVLQDNTPDTGCSLKVFTRETFIGLTQFDHMHRFLPALVQRLGGDVLSIAVNHRSRRHGASKYGVHNRLWTGIIDMIGMKWLQRRGLRPDVSEIE
jgi:glycosyltransferase involved in cell wall biosynthesis